jgi:hypothetical protein
VQAEHTRNAGTIEIDIQESYMGMLARQGESQIDGRHTLPDAAFAAHHNQLMFDAGHPRLDLFHLLGDLRNDLGVVGVLQFAQDGLQVFVSGHMDLPERTNNKSGTVTQRF